MFVKFIPTYSTTIKALYKFCSQFEKMSFWEKIAFFGQVLKDKLRIPNQVSYFSTSPSL